MGYPTDFYEVLNLSEGCTAQDIRKAYKILAKKWHPDKHPASSKAEAEARFKAISQAHEALTDEDFISSAAGIQESTTPLYRGLNQKLPLSGDSKKGYCTVAAAVRRKPEPVERKLECTLEELFWGCKKNIKFTREVITKTGLNIQKQELHTILVKPGWKKGTRITFESKGDEKPGWLPADVVFLVSEKCHPFFKRTASDLVLKVKVPLVNALTGWSFSFPAISGGKMNCSFRDEIIFPGYEKVIKGQGMPKANENGARGDLRIKFDIVFPCKLSEEQRHGIFELLNDAIY